MNRIKRFRIVALASAAALATLAAPVARADIFAATCVQGPTSQDIAIFNASLGTSVALPAAVNAADGNERHPSISSDGRRLVFQRLGSTGAQRLIAVDLSTGQSADLFTAFELAQDPIFRSAITPDGTKVATGRRFRFFGLLNRFLASATLTSLGTFPAGPFTRTSLTAASVGYLEQGIVLGVAAGGGNRIALEVSPRGGTGEIVLAQEGVGSSLPLRRVVTHYSQPALAAASSAQMLFVEQILFTEGGVTRRRPGDIVFRPATIASFVGTPTRLGFGVSTNSRDESLPALTADGRYVACVRDAEGANDRLFVWDSLTQTFLNPNGIDLGLTFMSSRCGSTSLYTRSIIGSSVISQVGNVNATLTLASSIGIFVQRIVGKTRVLGRKAYELETVGRFPLGMYGAGNVFTHWNFEVNGEPLAPGKYLVTVRAVEGDLVRELGKPQVMKIKKNGRVVIRGTEEDR